jgi:pimeloyl-ACP methyl ester carboxylesterase
MSFDLRPFVDTSADVRLPDDVRLKALAFAFFAPGNDPNAWLKGWSTAAAIAQREASDATPVDEWFSGGNVPILDLQAEFDVFRPRKFANALKDELGDRVEIQIVRGAGHALVPERPEEVATAIVDFVRRHD